MADEADLAFYAEQGHLTQALAAQPRDSQVLRRAGYCHNCGSTQAGERLFCDSDCASDWEYQDTLRRKLGLRPERAATWPGGTVTFTR
jgi:hypothetical protein